MPSIFTRIVAGEIPCYEVAETENCLAFLDINPLNEGHTLVIPKEEVDYIFDLDDDLLTELNLFAKKIARAIEKVVDCKRIGVAVIGLEVPHAHIHLVPIDGIHDLDFSKPKKSFTQEHFVALSARINEAIED